MSTLCFFKVKKTFVTSLHLNSKEPDLESDLILPSRAPFGSVKKFDWQFNDCGNYKGHKLSHFKKHLLVKSLCFLCVMNSFEQKRKVWLPTAEIFPSSQLWYFLLC
jgi:hypothetical protein